MKTLTTTKAIAVGLLVAAGTVSAAPIYKANNTTDLSTGTAWTGGAAPGSGDIAVWDATVTGALTNSLGANQSWGGIRILNPGGPVQINSGNYLTNGIGGIDLSQATRNLTLSNTVVIGNAQSWQVPAGRTLTLGNGIIKTAGGALRFYQPDLTASAAAVVVTNTGGWLTNGNVLYGTVNDVDFAAVDGSQHIVGFSVGGSYTANPAANPPKISGNLYSVYDFTVGDSGSYGIYANGNAVIDAVRINQTNVNNVSWQLNTYNKTLTVGSILITTNAGSLPVLVSGTGFLRIGNSGNQDLLLFQNNPAAPLVFQSTLGNGAAGLVQQGAGNLLKSGVGTVEIQTPASYTGGTRVYQGTLLLTGNGTVGAGALNVYGGRFVGGAGATNLAPTTVYAGATNGISVTAANKQYVQATNLTLQANSRLEFSFTNGLAPSQTAAALVATTANSTLTLSNPVPVDVVGAVPTGQYPLIKYGTLAGDGFNALALANHEPHTTAYLSNNIANSSIDLVVTANTSPIKWGAASGSWDVNRTANWKDSAGTTTTYQESGIYGDAVVFDDTAIGASPITVSLNTTVVPSAITVNATKNFSILGSGTLDGLATLTKQGSGTLTLGTTNTFAGGLNLNGGVASISSLNNLGAGAIRFNGGTLQYASGASADLSIRSVTFNAGGAAIDVGNNSVTYSQPLASGSVGGLTKYGAGTLTLSGTNTYYGPTFVSAGTLQLASLADILNSSALYVAGGAVLDAGTYSAGLSLNPAVNQVLAGNGTVTGDVIIPAGTRLTPATNGVAGTLTFNTSLTLGGGTINWDIANGSGDQLVVNGNLTITNGTLALNIAGTLANGTYKLIQYSGTLSGSAATLTVAGFAQSGQVATLSDATPNEIDLIVKSQSAGTVTWLGNESSDWDIAKTANWLNGGGASVYEDGENVIFDDSAQQTGVLLQATVRPASITVNNNSDYAFVDGTGTGAGRISGTTGLTKSGSGRLTINTLNNNSGPTVINAGTLSVGDSSSADIGTGPITNNGALIFGQTEDHSVTGRISGSGAVTQNGGGTLTLLQDNTYTGPTTISHGALQVGNGGSVGSLGTNSVTDNGTLIINRSGVYPLTNSISGSGSLAILGPVSLSLKGASTYQGSTYISNGIVKLIASEQIPDATTVSGASGGLILDGGTNAGVLDLGGFNESVNYLSGATGTILGLITNSAAAGTNFLSVGNAQDSSSTVYYGLIKDNASGAKIRLIKNGPGTLQLSGANFYSGGTLVLGGTLGVGYGAVVGTGSDPIYFTNSPTLALVSSGNSHPAPPNDLYVADNSTLTISSSVQANGFNGNLTGGSSTTNIISGTVSAGGSGKQWQSFLGTVVIPSTATLRISASGFNNGGDNTLFDLEGTLLLRYAGPVSLGTLTGAGSIGTPTSGIGTLIVGLSGADSTFSGVINGANNLVKSGPGTFSLTGTLAHTGSTTVSNGVLVLAVDTAALDSSTNIAIRSGATLDISSHTDGTLNLATVGQVLSGSGTLRGALVQGAGTTVNPGDTIGTLTVNGSASLGGTLLIELNRTNAGSWNDELAASSITATGGSALVVTNAGPYLLNGDTFRLLSAPLGGAFTTVTLPTTNLSGGSYVWTNRLAQDGTIKLLSGGDTPINTNAPVLSSAFSGSRLTLTWPTDHTGWRLETNAGSLTTAADWHTYTGATGTNQIILNVDTSKTNVFFRLVYP